MDGGHGCGAQYVLLHSFEAPVPAAVQTSHVSAPMYSLKVRDVGVQGAEKGVEGLLLRSNDTQRGLSHLRNPARTRAMDAGDKCNGRPV
jgi:hypothetical protein